MRLFIFPLCFATLAVPQTPPSDVTFHKNVEPILQKHCQECHRRGEIAPFSLLSYQDSRPWAKAIRENVISKKMPPWLADPQYGHFANDRSLSKPEIDTLVAWVDGGAKEGDPKDAPQPLAFVEGWNIPQPDLVLSMSQPFHVPAKAEVPYQYLVLPTRFTEDKWLAMAEVRPSNRQIVHHAVVFIRGPRSNWLREATPGVPFAPPPGDFRNISGGGNELLTAYTPGKVPDMWRPGIGKLIRAGSDLVLQIHYTPNGKETEDQIKIGLVFAKRRPPNAWLVLQVRIATSRFPRAIRIIAWMRATPFRMGQPSWVSCRICTSAEKHSSTALSIPTGERKSCCESPNTTSFGNSTTSWLSR